MLVIVSAGILTFFVPLITTSPAVLGKGRWSVFDLAWHVGQGELPPSHWSIHIVRLPLDPALIYLLLMCVLVAVFLPQVHKRLAWIAVLGIFLTLEMWQFDDVDFERTFYEQASYRSNFSLVHHVGFGQLVLALLCVYGSILFVVVREDLDTDIELPRLPQTVEASPDAGEPEFLDAEILAPENKRAGMRDNPPRLGG